MAEAVDRIVVQTTPQDKKAIAAKARKLDIPVSELMRRGAFAYQSGEAEEEFAPSFWRMPPRPRPIALAAAIDDALDFIEASNERIAAMEAAAEQIEVAQGCMMGMTDRVWAGAALR